MQIGEWCEPAPGRDRERADVFGGAGEVGGDAETGGGAAGLEDGGEKLVIAIRRLDKELGTMQALGFAFEIFECFGAARVVDGEIADKTKLLAVETAAHQGEQDRAGSYEGADGGA